VGVCANESLERISGLTPRNLSAQSLGNKRRNQNMTTKEKIKEIIDNQPDDATYEEIIRELAFSGMVERGLEDAREGRMISNKEMGKRIRLWQK